MKTIFLALGLTLLSTVAFAQSKVYQQACVNVSEIKQDIEERGISKSWSRTIEMNASNVVLTKTYFSEPDCKTPLRKHIYLGTVEELKIGQMYDGLQARATTKMQFTQAYVIRSGVLSYSAVNYLAAQPIDFESLSAELKSPLSRAAIDMQNATLYTVKMSEAMASVRKNPLNTIVSNGVEGEIIYLNKGLNLLK